MYTENILICLLHYLCKVGCLDLYCQLESQNSISTFLTQKPLEVQGNKNNMVILTKTYIQ